MTVNDDNSVSISYLDEMLEGQVAVLSSKYLSSEASLSVLNAMKSSKLFRPDQYSYLLYPYKDLKGFIERNTISKAAVASSKLLGQLVSDGNVQILEKDVNGDHHFSGNFKNANDLKVALLELSGTSYEALAKSETPKVLQIFEKLCENNCITMSNYYRLIDEASKRLKDDKSQVRKKAISIINRIIIIYSQIFKTNKFLTVEELEKIISDTKDNISTLCVLCHMAKTYTQKDYLGKKQDNMVV